jgi:hypothetical protein
MSSFYLFGSRVATHAVFWVSYFLIFGFIWADDGNYRDSYFLEFVLLPLRMLAVYLTIYLLIPRWLQRSHLMKLTLGYLLLIILCAVSQSAFTSLFYHGSTFSVAELWDFRGLLRNIVLINSTVLFVSALKITQLWWQEQDRSYGLEAELRDSVASDVIEIKADKRIHRVSQEQLMFVEGMGNYVTYHTPDKQYISYTSLKLALETLPAHFQRIHKSYVINTRKVTSYDQENVEINGKTLPVGRAYRNQLRITN